MTKIGLLVCLPLVAAAAILGPIFSTTGSYETSPNQGWVGIGNQRLHLSQYGNDLPILPGQRSGSNYSLITGQDPNTITINPPITIDGDRVGRYLLTELTEILVGTGSNLALSVDVNLLNRYANYYIDKQLSPYSNIVNLQNFLNINAKAVLMAVTRLTGNSQLFLVNATGDLIVANKPDTIIKKEQLIDRLLQTINFFVYADVLNGELWITFKPKSSIEYDLEQFGIHLPSAINQTYTNQSLGFIFNDRLATSYNQAARDKLFKHTLVSQTPLNTTQLTLMQGIFGPNIPKIKITGFGQPIYTFRFDQTNLVDWLIGQISYFSDWYWTESNELSALFFNKILNDNVKAIFDRFAFFVDQSGKQWQASYFNIDWSQYLEIKVNNSYAPNILYQKENLVTLKLQTPGWLISRSSSSSSQQVRLHQPTQNYTFRLPARYNSNPRKITNQLGELNQLYALWLKQVASQDFVTNPHNNTVFVKW